MTRDLRKKNVWTERGRLIEEREALPKAGMDPRPTDEALEAAKIRSKEIEEKLDVLFLIL